jgi:hypothetical protein
MKNFIALICFSFAMLLFMPHYEANASPEKQSTCFIQKVDIEPAVAPQEEGGVVADVATEQPAVTDEKGVGSFLLSHWAELLLGLLAFLKVIVNLTPTTKDNKIFEWLDNIINFFIPNLKKGGGTFSATSK